MFLDPGYRGLHIFPYSNHVKKMVKEVNERIRIERPELKYAIYMGREIEPNLCSRTVSPEAKAKKPFRNSRT